jgi:hypothetical protein
MRTIGARRMFAPACRAFACDMRFARHWFLDGLGRTVGKTSACGADLSLRLGLHPINQSAELSIEFKLCAAAARRFDDRVDMLPVRPCRQLGEICHASPLDAPIVGVLDSNSHPPIVVIVLPLFAR